MQVQSDHNYYRIEMKPQAKWLWDHAIYLFLGGMAGAVYAIAGITMLFFNPANWAEFAQIGIYLAFPAGVAASAALMLGLGNPMKAVHSWKKPGTSWIARGVFIWTVFLGVAFIHFITLLLGIDIGGLNKVLFLVGTIAAFGIMVYTGFLLSAARAIAFWSTGALPSLFLVGALASGFLAMIFFGALTGAEGGEKGWLFVRYGALIMLVLQAFITLFHIQATHSSPEGRVSANLLMKGESSALFWGGAIILGLAVPLLLLVVGGGSKAVLIVAAAAGLVGNLALRQAILKGGVFARLKAGRFEFVLTNP